MKNSPLIYSLTPGCQRAFCSFDICHTFSVCMGGREGANQKWGKDWGTTLQLVSVLFQGSFLTFIFEGYSENRRISFDLISSLKLLFKLQEGRKYISGPFHKRILQACDVAINNVVWYARVHLFTALYSKIWINRLLLVRSFKTKLHF